MEETELAAIGKFVMRDRQHLGCLRVRDGVITLERMFFHDEIRPVDEIAPTGVRVAKEELEMAKALIEKFTAKFAPEKYEDTYREALLDVIRAKRKGKTITAPEPETEEQPTDLLAALRASVESAKRSKPRARAKRAPARRQTGRKATRR